MRQTTLLLIAALLSLTQAGCVAAEDSDRAGRSTGASGSHGDVAREARASRCVIRPAVPVSGEQATLTYDPAGGPLEGAATIQVRLAYNDWSGRIGAVCGTGTQDQVMARDLAARFHALSFTVPEVASVLNMAFHDASERPTWDNNDRSNWNFEVKPGLPPEPIPDPPRLAANASRAHVMMQGFYWGCPVGVWYDTMASRARELRDMRGGHGIDRIWFPPPSKGNHADGMGYDPYDYYDLGAYDQKGAVRTRFGTQEQLRNAIRRFRELGIACMADVVLNHRSGGREEPNSNLGDTKTWTDYSRVLSGKCTWRHNQFHPSTFEHMDEGAFGGFADVCTATGNSPGTPRYDLVEWGRWLQGPANAGFDGGWRFDFAKGFRPSFVAEFRDGTNDAFGMLECWSGEVTTLDAYVAYSGGTAALDFPGHDAMRKVFSPPADEGAAAIAKLVDRDRAYAARNPAKAVTFVANHDTDKTDLGNMIARNKMLAYAFILTYQGYPCIFWRDYFDLGLADLGGAPGNGIRALVWVRGALGGGSPAIESLKADDRHLLAYGTTEGSVGAPGYVVGINNHGSIGRSATVTTSNGALRGRTLRCYAWFSYVEGRNSRPPDVACGPGGGLTIAVPPRGYAVYGPAGIARDADAD